MLSKVADQNSSTGEELNPSLRVLALNKRSWHHSSAGGSELNLEETTKRLAQREHEVHLLTGSDGGRPRTELDDSVFIHRVGFDEKVPAPWDVVISYLTISLYFYWYLYKLSPDVVYTVNTPLPWPVVTRKPRVSIFHHIAINSFFETHPFPQNVLGYVSQSFGVFRERQNLTISVSPSTTEELVNRGHSPETVYEIRNGLDVERYRPGTESSTPRIVYIGGLERYKGVDRIPEIHEMVQEISGTSIRLDVAGRDGPVKDTIAEYCSSTSDAHYHGFVSLEKKIDLLQSAWVFIAPSRVEGWGIAVLEANACGTPAVGRNVSGLRDSIRHNETGLLVDGADPNEFAKAVYRLLEDTRLRREVGENARNWAEKHTWETSTDQLEELLLSTVPETDR
ncbi:glycosyltransferase family 4 protein [Saliphagus infecundisoli]|uniref:Glycosyltransferase family 4 protein n=1 Tax=Saliphagus infecundisoli TaxID=1849069 RepID=A0ABD5QH44_9EURY|nr:glycosyltransferase family 4 protein [Saliphagus infecundisoli]